MAAGVTKVRGTIPSQPPELSYPIGYVNYANNATSQVGQLTDVLRSIAGSLQPPVISPVFPTGGSAPALTAESPPSLIDFVWDAPGAGPSPFDRTLNVDGLLPATFDAAPPTLVFGVAPAAVTEAIPSSPSLDLNIALPAEPSIAFPAAPALLSLSTYTFQGLNLPTLDATLPTLDVVTPTIREYVPGTGYTSGLLTQVEAALAERLRGGTGLPAAVEQAIWDRGRERETKQLADAFADLERMEALGYSFPPGSFIDARLKLQTEFAAQAHGYSREVMIKQAELEQTNIRHALEQSITLESKLLDSFNQAEQRMLEAAKYITQAGIETYNAKVRAYSAYVEAYKTKATIYEAQIRGEIAKVDAYKAEIEAEKAKAEINTALVNQYKTQIDASLAVVELYKAELQAVQTKATIEKMKIEVYGEQVKAFGAKINAYTAQVEGYKAATQAEGVKQDAYKSQVDAYSAKVGAQVKVIESKISEFKGLVEAKTAEYEGYKALVSASSEHIKGISAYNSAVAEMYKARISGTSTYNETLTKQWQVALDQAQRVSDIANNAAKLNAEMVMQSKGVMADAAKGGAQVWAQLGAAALNAINWSSSYSTSNTLSNSLSDAFSESLSFVTQFTP